MNPQLKSGQFAPGSAVCPVAALCTVLAALFGAAPLAAQLSAGFSVASFQFNLSNPGARSLGLGGAFTGLADDATAAYANPAGLTTLSRPEVSFEGRAVSFRLPLVAAEPIVNGVVFSQLEVVDGRAETVFEQVALGGVAEATPLGAPDASGSTASFFSFVLPRGDWTFALYRHQLVDLEAAAGVVLPEITTTALTSTVATSGSTRSRARVDLAGIGVAASRGIGQRLALGLTLVYNRASIEARRTSEFVERVVLGPFPPSETPLRFENLVQGEDSDLSINAGLLLRPALRWTVGLSLRRGASFELRELDRAIRSDQEFRRELDSSAFEVPDVLSVGASCRATRRLIVALEWDRVRYSDLRRPASIPDSLARFGPANDPGALERLGSFTVDDADELRVGLEYSFWQLRSKPSVRLGAWHDPDHQVRFEAAVPCPGAVTGDGGSRCSVEAINPQGPLPDGLVSDLVDRISDATAARSLELLFPRGEDRLHWAGGFGLVVGSRFQLDVAFDYVASDQYTLSLSGIARF